MTFVSIPNGVRIAHLGSVAGVPVVNTVGCINGSGQTGSSLDDLAKSHGDAWRANFLPFLNSQYLHINTLAYSLEDQSAAVGDAGYSGAQGGAQAGGMAPVNCAVVIALKTAKRGRTYQGRMYICGFDSNAFDGTGLTWNSTTTSAVATAIAAYKGAVDPNLEGDNGAMAVCSRGNALKGIDPHVEKVTGFIVRQGIGTQRRRLS